MFAAARIAIVKVVMASNAPDVGVVLDVVGSYVQAATEGGDQHEHDHVSVAPGEGPFGSSV